MFYWLAYKTGHKEGIRIKMNLDSILSTVEKPARYTGGELNSVFKEHYDIRFVFAFPDTYEIGMSHLGGKIIYHSLNEREDTFCERVYAPAADMEAQMREHGMELFSLESRRSIREADLIGFTLQYEMSYTNILNMLDMANIPLWARDRTEGPLVFAGGPCAYHAEPLADFMDFFALGDGEEELHDLMVLYKQWKGTGQSKQDFLLALAQLPGFYVPAFYDVTYNQDGTVKAITPNRAGVPERAVRRVVQDFENAFVPTRPVVPFVEAVHDRITIEICRGCTRGCRFCQAGYVYRPVRERSVDKLCTLLEETVANTGYDEISLSSLSSGDYSNIQELTSRLSKQFKGRRVAASLPSLRLDSFNSAFVSHEMRRSSLTFAPEAGSQRLRDVINKNVTQEDFIKTMRSVFDAGYSSVKLYFMLGLPTETYEDIDGIAELAKICTDIYREKTGSLRGLRVVVSTSFFVPKPFTPFQWCAQDTEQEQTQKRIYLASKLRSVRGVEYKYHESKLCFLEAAFARGDRRLARVLYTAFKKGCRLDGWSEHFRYDLWQQAFNACGLNLDFYASRARAVEEVLPWDVVDCGVSKQYFIKELQKSEAALTTPDCRNGCTGCGMNKLMGGKCPCEQ